MIETKELKKQFPIFRKIPNLVYLDNAATTQKPERVINRISKFYSEENANVHRGLYPISDKATEMYENARRRVADFINADPQEIIFTSGATESINGVARALKASGFIAENPRIVLTDLEHHSNILPWQQLRPEVIQYLSLDKNFQLKDEKFMPKADIFAAVHISNVTGTIVPIRKLIKANKYPYSVVDATQSIAHIPIDVKDLGVDFLTFSGHKAYGPTGVGILYVKKEILEELEPFSFGGGMIDNVERDSSTWARIPSRFEAGTPNIAGSIALAESLDFISELGFDYIQKQEENLRKHLVNEISKINGIEIYHPAATQDALGVVSFNLDKVHSHDVAQSLGDLDICVRAGHHCTQILHKNLLQKSTSVRASIGIYNSEQDIDILCKSLKKIKSKF